MLHQSLIVAPNADFAICVEVIILQVLFLALPHGRVSPSGSSSCMSGFSLACTRRARRLLGLLYTMVSLSVKTSIKVREDSVMGQCLLTISITFGKSG